MNVLRYPARADFPIVFAVETAPAAQYTRILVETVVVSIILSAVPVAASNETSYIIPEQHMPRMV